MFQLIKVSLISKTSSLISFSSFRSQWIVAKNREEAEAKARRELGADDVITIEQDPDVLDTWFSSAIYPFAALGWPNDNESLRK